MALPGLHVVTNDDILASDGFIPRACALIRAHGASIALHLRGPRSPVRRLLDVADTLAPLCRDAGALLLVNDRADVALAVGADGVQLSARSIPVAVARGLHHNWVVGASVHGLDEAVPATEADFLVVGTIWATASHPGRPGAGLDRVRAIRERVDRPLIAIGGVTPERTEEARAAGAHGVAVIRGVWDAADAVEAAGNYLRRLGAGGTGRDEA